MCYTASDVSMEFLNDAIRFLAETPFLELMQYALVLFAWPPIAGVMIWGLLQIWVDYKQGKFAGNLKWVIYQVRVPAEAIQTPKGMENVFNVLAGAKSTVTWKEKWLLGKFQPWFSFEIVSDEGRVSFYIRTQVKYADMVVGAMYSQYPEAQIIEVEDYAKDWPEDFPNDTHDGWGSMFKLAKPSFMPIKTYVDFEHMGEKDQRFKDPLLVVLEQLGRMQPGERYAIQFLIMPCEEQDDWRKPGIKYIEEKYGKSAPKGSASILANLAWIPAEMINQVASGAFGIGAEEGGSQDDFAMLRLNPEEQDQVKAIARKIGKLGWWTKIRFIYVAKHEVYRKGSIASMSKGIFHLYGHLGMNRFGLYGPSTPKDDYFWQEWSMNEKLSTVVKRFKARSFGTGSDPFALNSEELATLFHFPPADARTPVLIATPAKMGEAPADLQYVSDDVPTIPVMGTDLEQKSEIPSVPQPLSVPRPQGLPPLSTSQQGQTSVSQTQTAEPPLEQNFQQPLRSAFSRPVAVPPPSPKGIEEPIPMDDLGGAPPNLPI